MIYKEHTRNQKRMYRIHKQEEKIQEQELIIASLQQKIDKAIENIKNNLEEAKTDVVGIGKIVVFNGDIKELLEILGDK